jgi:hypothetical protein
MAGVTLLHQANEGNEAFCPDAIRNRQNLQLGSAASL